MAKMRQKEEEVEGGCDRTRGRDRDGDRDRGKLQGRQQSSQIQYQQDKR